MAENDDERELNDSDAPETEEELASQPEDTNRDSVESARGQEKPKSKIPTNAGDLKGMATGAAANMAKNAAGSAPGVGEAMQKAEEVKQKVEQANRIVNGVKAGAEAAAGFAKGFVAFVINPWAWVTALVLLVVTVLIITAVTSVQVYGTTKTTSTGGAAGEMLERLAQRGDWLQNHYTEFGGDSGQLFELAESPKSSLSPNPWASACPNIVALIYGLSPYLVNYMGNANAYQNYKAHPEMYEAWSFSTGSNPYGQSWGDGTSSPGATLTRPPAGAIVSIHYGTPAGHTFVMLTDELVIDNGGGGIAFGPPGPRVVSDTQRGQITGWALPKSEGFEGTFITGTFEGAGEGFPAQAPMPNLGAVPEWASAAAAAAGS